MFDFKISNDELFELPGGPAGILIGMERRKESYTDDRDPYLDFSLLDTYSIKFNYSKVFKF